MRLITLTGFLCLGVAALAQNVHYDYDRAANFSAYRTYQWTASNTGQAPDPLTDQNIKRAVDEQLALKGLQRVEYAGDLHVAYRAAVDREKQFSGFTVGPRWNGFGQINTSTIETGKLTVQVFDPARNQLVWRGDAEKALDLKNDPDKNYRNLQKAVAKLFRNYPPASSQK